MARLLTTVLPLLALFPQETPEDSAPAPLSQEQIRAAQDWIRLLALDEVARRDEAAENLFRLGAAVIPLVREAERDEPDEEIRSRLRSILDRFPKLRAILRLPRASIRMGESLEPALVLRNASDHPVQVIHCLDASDVGWRYPKVLVEITDAEGNPQSPPRFGRCGNMNALSLEDFSTLPAGEEFLPVKPGSFGHWAFRWKPEKPGQYRIRWTYDAAGEVPDAWWNELHLGPLDAEVIDRLRRVPRDRFESPWASFEVVEGEGPPTDSQRDR